jgi:hypothetical protein
MGEPNSPHSYFGTVTGGQWTQKRDVVSARRRVSILRFCPAVAAFEPMRDGLVVPFGCGVVGLSRLVMADDGIWVADVIETNGRRARRACGALPGLQAAVVAKALPGEKRSGFATRPTAPAVEQRAP